MLRLVFNHSHLCVFGKVEHHRTRTARACNVERAAHCPSHIFGAANLIGPFRYWLRNAHKVNLLKGVGAKESRTHLTSNHHNWGAVHHCVGNACYCVSYARSACYKADTNFSAYSRITLCGVRGGLLVAYQYVIQRFTVVVECIECWHYGSARIAEHHINTLVLQRPHKCLCTSYFLFHFLIVFSNRFNPILSDKYFLINSIGRHNMTSLHPNS